MSQFYTLKQVRELGQKAKRLKYENVIQKMTFKYGRWVPRLISPYITWFILRVFPGTKPDTVSYAVLAVCIAGLVMLFRGAYLAGAVLLYLSIVLDKVDGELARIKNIFSLRGVFLDSQYHFIYRLCWFLVGIGMALRGNGLHPLAIGSATALLGIYLRYTRSSYKAIVFKVSPELRSLKEAVYFRINNRYVKRAVTGLQILCREDNIAVLLIVFSVIEKYDAAYGIILYMRLYLYLHALLGFIVFLKSMRGEVLGRLQDSVK
ncbi:MAG: CDP-alcohol phosphatidyltransferase family protein [Elusimicrobia bacterium]|nr:CDP-alcohol phosphatidyltransferase family protein [Elusimicrobiota bacterium]